jgi:hypothetical protein
MQIGQLEYDHQDFEKPRAGDEKLAIRFFKKAKQDGEATQKEGRPIFIEVEYIQIMVPGDRTSTIIRPVVIGDTHRFGKQYEHWKKTQQEEQLLGTPLEAWGIMNLAQIEEYRYFGVRTIDQMAELRDDICGKIMGAQPLKQKAIQFLALAKDEAPMKRVQSELDKRDTEISALRNALEEQGKALQALQAKMKD